MKLSPERTEDVDFLVSIFTHPKVWPWVSEDGQRPEDYKPLIHPMVHYLRYGNVGAVSFRQMGAVLFEGHVAMLPGVRSDAFLRDAIDWMWANTRALALYCHIPADNRQAIWYAMRGGFSREGLIPRAFLRDGKLHDLIVLGVSKWQKP